MEADAAVSSGRRAGIAGADPVRQGDRHARTRARGTRAGPFDGIVIATDWGLRFIDADRVELITICNIRCSLDDAEAGRLPPPDGAAVYQVSSLDEIGDSLHERLGRMFRRPYWTRE